MFLSRTTYVACRFFIHATLFSCAACSQRKAAIHGPLTREASARCIWNDYVALPALNQYEDDTMGGATTFQIRRQKAPDLVERFWLNDREWFQISPRSFVIFFVSCIALASFSGALDGSFASIGSHVSKKTAFYVTVAFTFASIGHTPIGDNPELMFVPLRHYFSNWKDTTRAIIATILIHAGLLFVAPIEGVSSSAIPLACTIIAPLLLAGLSRPVDPAGQEANDVPGIKGQTTDKSSKVPASPTTKAWTIDSTLVWSSSKIRCLDLRVLLLGLSVTLFDVSCNQYRDEMSITRWPISAVVSIFVTAIWLYLENSVPRSRDLEPGILSLAAAALVGIFSHVNFLDAFGLYDDEWEDENFTHFWPVPEDASHSKPIIIALCYTTLIYIVVVHRQLVHHKTDRAILATKGQPPQKDHLLFGFHVKTSQINFGWQLRNSHVGISLLFAVLASWLGDNWPLDMNTTDAGLLLFLLIVGFQLRPGCDNLDEKRSLYHVAAVGFSALMTILAVGLNRRDILTDLVFDPMSDRKAATSSAMVFHSLSVAVGLRLEGRGLFTRRNHAAEPPLGGLQDDKKAIVQESERQRNLNVNANAND